MKLTDLIKDIENIDQEAIVFQQDIANFDSDIIFGRVSDLHLKNV